jgi:hypothetical protein
MLPSQRDTDSRVERPSILGNWRMIASFFLRTNWFFVVLFAKMLKRAKMQADLCSQL